MDEADLELVKDWLTRAHQDLRASLILAAAEDAPLDVALKEGMEEKHREFTERGSELYAKA